MTLPAVTQTPQCKRDPELNWGCAQTIQGKGNIKCLSRLWNGFSDNVMYTFPQSQMSMKICAQKTQFTCLN